MSFLHYFLLVGFAIFLLSSIFIIFKILRANYPPEYSQPLGKTGSAIIYSFTRGMSPFKKESAYLHLPTYIAGIIYHIGTFAAFFILFIIFFNINLDAVFINVSFLILVLSGLCGFLIFLKRIFKSKLRKLSNLDDFVSNLIVTIFQLLTSLSLLQSYFIPYLFVCSTILLIIIPISKLRHSIYFFATRIQLGKFYGWRGVWPLKKKGSFSA